MTISSIRARPKSDLFSVREAGAPLGIGRGMMNDRGGHESRGFSNVVRKLASRQRRSGKARVDAGLNPAPADRTTRTMPRFGRSRVVLAVAVAVGRHVPLPAKCGNSGDRRTTPWRTPPSCRSVPSARGAFRKLDGIEVAGADALPSRHNLHHDAHLFRCRSNASASFAHSRWHRAAAAAQLWVDRRLPVVVLILLARAEPQPCRCS